MTTETAPASPVPGFRIVRRIGRGGHGDVYEAVRLGPGGFRKQVAIKRLAVRSRISAGAVEQFLNEARVCANLEHTNVVRVYDLIAGEDGYYMIMELLRGRDLWTLIKGVPGRRLPTWVALLVVERALRGLAYVHAFAGEDGARLGLLHRDLTPPNVFVCNDGEVKILDFGIAKLSESAGAVKTMTGVVRGTPEFLSPEQVRSETLDARTDVYQLGATLFCALCGQPPFGTGRSSELLDRIAAEPPQRLEDLGEFSPELCALVDRAVHYDPDARYPDADAMREAVAAALQEYAAADTGSLARWLANPVAAEAPTLLDRHGATDPDSPLSRLGLPELPERFELSRVIGRGGMGLVVAAHDNVLEREVAVKLLHESRWSDVAVRERFLREARAAAALGHAAIVGIYDFDEDGRYIVMELVRGGSLADRIRADAPLPPLEVSRIGIEVAEALAVAHEASIVHRDVKPGNVLFDEAGGVHLADFGIAYVFDSDLTVTGQTIGTPGYMSPEQLRARPIDFRSDVYSLGVTLFEAATGTRFHGEDIVTDAEDYVTQVSGDQRLAAVIARCLEDDPGDRFGDARQLAAALRGDISVTVPARPAGRRRWLAPAVVMLAAAGIAIVATIVSAPAPAGHERDAGVPATQERKLAFLPFSNESDRPELDFARSGLAHLLGNELRRTEQVSVIGYYRMLDMVPGEDAADATWLDAARDAGATAVVRGRIANDGDGIVIEVAVVSLSGQQLARASRRGALDDLPRMAGEVSAELLAAVGEQTAGPPRAALTLTLERELQLGIHALELHDLEQATERLGRVIDAYPDHPEARYHLAVATWWMSRPAKETQAHIGAAVAGSLDPERKRFLVGLRMLLESDYPAVVAYFDQLADDYPGNRDAIYGQFEALFHGGHPLEAVATYRRVIELAPGFGLGLMHPLAYHISRGDDRGARWALDRAGSSPGVWHVRALVAQRRHGEALALARELLRGASDEDAVGRAGALAEIAAIHAAAGRLDEAEAIDGANRASLLAARGDRAGADAAHDEALAAAIALPEGIARYDAVLQVAFARSPDSRADEARPIVEALEQSSPQFSESLISRAAAAILYGHLSESEHIDSASNSPYPEVSAIGQAFSREAAADWPGAADAWRRAIASNGDGRLRVTEQFLLARALRRAERFEAVIAACDEVILPHLFSWAWGEAVGPCLLWTAQAHEALGRHRDACRTTDRLASMRDRAPRRDPVLAAARALDCE